MSRRRLSSSNLTTIIVAIIGTISAIAVAYFGFLSNKTSIELPINTTQTAAAKVIDYPSSILSTASVMTDTLAPIPTETVQATLTPTQIPVTFTITPKVLFRDNFDTNAYGWVLGVRNGKVSRQDRQITDGALQLDTKFSEDGAYSWVNVPDFRVENFRISVDVEIVQFPTRSKTGIVFPFRLTNGGDTAYAIEIDNDGTYALYSTQTLTKDGHWTLLHREESDLIQLVDGTVTNITIRVLGQKFTVYLNGVELFTFEDNSIRGAGNVGIGLTGEAQKSAIVKFDNLIITK